MAATHMRVQNVILFKRYVTHLLFHKSRLTVVYRGGNRACFNLMTEPTEQEVAGYLAELEDRD